MIVETISARRVMLSVKLRIRVTGARRMRLRILTGAKFLELARLFFGCEMAVEYHFQAD